MTPATTSPQLLHDRISRALQAGAMAEAERLLNSAPQDANFNALRGILAQMQSKDAEAIALFDAVLEKRPNATDILMNKARSLTRLRNFNEAIALLETLKNDLPGAAVSMLLSETYDKMGRKKDSLAAMGQAIAAGAKIPEIVSNYWIGRREMCDWSEPLPTFQISELTPAAATVLSDDPIFQRHVAEYFCRTRFMHYAPKPDTQAVTDRRIRLGYLSADIHTHATAFLIAELFDLHDREKFEVFCFSYGGDDGSAIRKRIEQSVEHFVDLRHGTQLEMLEKLKAAEVDILIDLKGHTRNNALPVLSQRPASTCIHYLGHPGSIGAPFVDYIIGDPVVTPEGCEEYYAEKILRMPHSYQINDRNRDVVSMQPRAAYGLPDSAVVLAVFNQTYKITPQMFGIWCEILRERENTVLWLFESIGEARENLKQQAKSKGVDPTRLYFAPYVPNSEHLARYNAVDIMMDTYPYGGHTTTSDALWMGTPVITLAGKTYPSRVAASLLTAVGLPQLVADTIDDYKAKILSLIDDDAQRKQLRAHLTDTRASCPLFDTPQWVRDWEALLGSLV